MHEEVMVAAEVMEEIEEEEYSLKKMWNAINITNLDTFNLNVQVLRIKRMKWNETFKAPFRIFGCITYAHMSHNLRR